MEDYENTLCVSAETVRELVIQFNKGKLVSKFWKTAEEMVESIKGDYYIDILPLKEEQMRTYANLRINNVQDHNDPSDHVIISHAMTENMILVSSDTRFPFYRRQGLKLLYNER